MNRQNQFQDWNNTTADILTKVVMYIGMCAAIVVVGEFVTYGILSARCKGIEIISARETLYDSQRGCLIETYGVFIPENESHIGIIRDDFNRHSDELHRQTLISYPKPYVHSF